MPFSATQIVVSKIAVASSMPMLISVMALNSVCLGYGIREGRGAFYVIGILISSVLIPVTGITLATLLVVVFFRVFGFIRNRDITVALGGIFTFGLTIAYIVISNVFTQKSSSEVAASLHLISSVAASFPTVSFMSKFMFEGNIPGLLISLVISAAVIFLAVLAVKAFYLNT